MCGSAAIRRTSHQQGERRRLLTVSAPVSDRPHYNVRLQAWHLFCGIGEGSPGSGDGSASPCSVVKEKFWSAGAVPDLNKAISITAVTSIERRAETGLEGGGRALVDMQLGCRTNRRSWQGRGCNAQHDAERSDRARRSVAVTGVGCVSLSLSLSDERHTQESILQRTVAM